MVGVILQALPELTPGQARAVAAVRARWPQATLTFHARPWGYILEVRGAGPGGSPRTIGLARFDADGAILPDAPVRPPAAAEPPAAA